VADLAGSMPNPAAMVQAIHSNSCLYGTGFTVHK